jgi:ATP-dependent Clp protease adaptor protein ClpS
MFNCFIHPQNRIMASIITQNPYISPELVDQDVLLDIEERSLILFNDDFNTFDDVIAWLIEICDHNAEQAEQCAYIVHFNGKCEVKRGSFEFLKPKANALMDRGLTVEIH